MDDLMTHGESVSCSSLRSLGLSAVRVGAETYRGSELLWVVLNIK